VVGQRGEGLNMVDLSLLPLTPIMGSGLAPLQVRANAREFCVRVLRPSREDVTSPS
jgi:hypothetical protein